jgi:hypothetical protein
MNKVMDIGRRASLARDSSEVEKVKDGELLLRNILRGSNGHAGRIVRVLALQKRAYQHRLPAARVTCRMPMGCP